jgi:23S rRNA pseudouridine1911/1915/1917 synthase
MCTVYSISILRLRKIKNRGTGPPTSGFREFNSELLYSQFREEIATPHHAPLLYQQRVAIPHHGPDNNHMQSYVFQNATEQAEIVYLDQDLCLLSKPVGLPSQPTRSDPKSALSVTTKYLQHQKIASTFLAPAHRLDASTSGILCLCRSPKTAPHIQKQLSEHHAARIYLAIIDGEPPWEERSLRHFLSLDPSRSWGTVVGPTQGREARSEACVLARHNQKSLVALAPQTGLTHQLRLQLAAEGFPILGDARYGHGGRSRLFLHAWYLALRHPSKPMTLHIELSPSDSFWRGLDDTTAALPPLLRL